MTFRKDQKIAQILGIRLNSTSMDWVLEKVIAAVDRKQKLFIATPNSEFIVYAKNNPWFKKLLNSADIAIPDSIGLVWASRILNLPLKEKIDGVDLVHQLLILSRKKHWRVGVIGARRGVSAQRKNLLANLKEKYPGVDLFLLEEYPNLKKIHFDILFACQGMGKQEQWIRDNLQTTSALVFVGIGGALDQLAGLMSRPPRWIREMGFGWLYRLIRQPWRLTRQLALLKFIWLVIKEKI